MRSFERREKERGSLLTNQLLLPQTLVVILLSSIIKYEHFYINSLLLFDKLEWINLGSGLVSGQS